MADLDRLQIQIEASAAEAMPALDDVINKLTDLNNALRGVGNAGKSFQKSMTGLSNTSITLGRSVGSGFGKALTKGIEGSIQNAFKGVGSIIKNISKMAVIGIPSLGIKGFQLVGSGFKLVGKGALEAASGIKTFAGFLKGAHAESKNLTSVLMGLYMRLWGLKKAASAFVGIAKKATDFVESYHYFETAFAKIGQDAADSWSQYGYDSAEAYAKSFKDRALGLTELMSGYSIDSQGNASLTGGKSLGMDPEMLMNYQAQYGQMANGLGLVSESAFNASKALTMLGADWSSLRNIDFSTSYEKMASALAGQSRAVRSLGIDITQATLQQYAYAAGISASVSEMSQAAKAELRLIAILDQSRVAWGDMAKTLNTPANQMRLLQQNAASLARTIGNLMIPVLAKVLPYINGVVLALQRLFAWLGSILGINVGEIATGMGGMADEMEDFGDSLVEGIEQAEDDSEDLLDDLKEAKKTILGFDELNVLNAPYSDTKKPSKKDDDSKKWNPADMGKLDSLLDSLLAEYEKKWLEAFNSMTNRAKQIADAIVDAFKKKDWYGLGQLMASGVEWALGKIYEFLDPNTIYPKIKKVTDAVTTVINSFIQNFPATLFGQTLGRMLNTYVFTMNQLYDGIDWPSIGQKLATAFLGLLNEVDPYELGRLLTQKFRAAVSILVGFFSEMQGQWDDVGRKLGTMISGALSNIHPEDIAFVLSNAINAGIHILAGLIETFPWDEVSDKITTGINDMIAWIEWDNLGATLGLALMKITTTITRILTGIHWEDLGRGMGAGLLRFVNAIDTDAPGELLAAGIKGILTFLYSGINEFRTGGGFKKLAEMAAGCIKAVFANQEIWDELGLLLKEMLRSAIDFLLVLDENIPWADIGTQIHDFIFGIIDNDKLWNDAFKALHDWLVDICTFINAALPQGPDEWEKIGKRIAQFLEDIPWGTLFDTVVSNLADAIVGLWRGLGSSFVGRCVRAIVAVGITWTVFSPLISAIGRIFVMDKVTSLLAGKIASALGTGLTDGAAKVPVRTGLFSFKTKIGEVLSKIASLPGKIKTMLDSALTEGANAASELVAANGGIAGFTGQIAATIGSAGVIIGVGAAFLGVCKKFAEGIELLQGGNGTISETGSAWHDLTAKLYDSKAITIEQKTEIDKLIESLETDGATTEEVGSRVTQAFQDAGVSASEYESAVYNTGTQLSTTNGQIEEMTTHLGEFGEGVSATKGIIDMSIPPAKDSFAGMRDVLDEMYFKNVDVSTSYMDLDNTLTNVQSTSGDAQSAFDAIVQTLGEDSEAAQIFIGMMKEKFPEAVTEGLGTAEAEAKTKGNSIKGNITTPFGQMVNATKGYFGQVGSTVLEKLREAAGNADKKSGEARDAMSKAFGQASTNANTEFGTMNRNVNSKLNTIKTDAGSKTTAMATELHKRYKTIGDSLPNHFKNIGTDIGAHFDGITTEAGETIEDIDKKFRKGVQQMAGTFDLYSVGQGAMDSLQNGINSRGNITLPHIYKGGDDRYYYGDGGWFDIPWFSISWYAKGGLATAPTLAGIGEAGQEAVLPLTNKRAMSNIADAIVSGGGLGMSHDDMVEAVATGVAMAMAQNPQTVELVVNSVLKTDDEKLAQSVSRGRARLDQRFNTVSAF